MKRHLLKFVLLVSTLGFTTIAGASDRWETLRAINWVENPTNQTHVGRFGELGPYQFRPATWRMHTDKPFRQAIDRTVADEVAVKHYEWIKRTFEQAGIEPNAFISPWLGIAAWTPCFPAGRPASATTTPSA